MRYCIKKKSLSSCNRSGCDPYDNLDRLVKKQYNGGNDTEYACNAEGALAELRYRGCYDTETGFYSLQSHYYDPANRRFLNADYSLK